MRRLLPSGLRISAETMARAKPKPLGGCGRSIIVRPARRRSRGSGASARRRPAAMRPVAGDLAGEARDALAEAAERALLQAFEFLARCHDIRVGGETGRWVAAGGAGRLNGLGHAPLSRRDAPEFWGTSPEGRGRWSAGWRTLVFWPRALNRARGRPPALHRGVFRRPGPRFSVTARFVFVSRAPPSFRQRTCRRGS